MSLGYFSYPMPVNEPVLSYAPGSPERKRLKEVLTELKKEKTPSLFATSPVFLPEENKMTLADDSGSPVAASNTLPCENAGKNKLLKKINAKSRFIKEAPIYETIGKVNCYYKRLRILRFLLAHQIRFYKSIQLTIHNRLHISHFKIGTMIFDHFIWMKNIRTYL